MHLKNSLFYSVSVSELKPNCFLGYLVTHLYIDDADAVLGCFWWLDFCLAWQHLHYLQLQAGNASRLCAYIGVCICINTDRRVFSWRV